MKIALILLLSSATKSLGSSVSSYSNILLGSSENMVLMGDTPLSEGEEPVEKKGLGSKCTHDDECKSGDCAPDKKICIPNKSSNDAKDLVNNDACRGNQQCQSGCCATWFNDGEFYRRERSDGRKGPPIKTC